MKSIPPWTRAALANPAPPGSRHRQMLQISLSLIGNGYSPEAVFVELRGAYDATVPDSEIRDVINWACSKNPTPSGYRGRYINSPALAPITAVSATAAVERLTGGTRCDEADYFHASSLKPLEDWRLDILLLLAVFYYEPEFINIVSEHAEGRPVGAGRTMKRDGWMHYIREQGVPQCAGGAWFRFNPVAEMGSGKGNAICDADVTAHRFLLVESDILPMEMQLAFFGRVRLPIAALILSGGKSVHGLIRMDCTDTSEYREQSRRILKMLRPYGFDGATGNASRMARLPGCARQIGANDIGEQKLLYIDPEPRSGERIFA